MEIKKQTNLRGTLTVPGDKSISHRAVMFGSLAKGTTCISHFLEGADCLSTISCFRKMGISIERRKFEILVHGKGLHGLSAPEALSMATREGALSQGRADCGDIKVGFRADIVALRMDTIAMTPAHSPLSNLLYAAGRGNVAMTMVDGRILYRDGAFSTIDIERVRYEAGKRALDIARR